MSDNGVIYHFDRDFALATLRFGDIVLYQIGELYCDAGRSTGRHLQWCYEITYIESGSGTILSNGRTFPVHANDIVITGKDCAHEIISGQDNQLRFLYLGFDIAEEKKAAPNTAEILRFFDASTQPCAADQFHIGNLLQNLLREFYCEYDGFHEIVASYLDLVIRLTYRNARPAARPSAPVEDSKKDVGSAVYRVVRYIDDHLYEIDSIRSIAAKLNYNYSYLSYMFKKCSGITLQKYIAGKKMERAQLLLSEGGQSISQAASTLGYKNTQSFNKAFHAAYGISPSAFMKQHKKEEFSQ